MPEDLGWRGFTHRKITFDPQTRIDMAEYLGLKPESPRAIEVLAVAEDLVTSAVGIRAGIEQAPQRAERLRLLDRVIASATDLRDSLDALDPLTMFWLVNDGYLEIRRDRLDALIDATDLREDIERGKPSPPRHPEEARDEAIRQLAKLFRQATGTAKDERPDSLLDFIDDALEAAGLPRYDDDERRGLIQRMRKIGA